MIDASQYIEDTYNDLDDNVSEMEDNMQTLVNDYLADFYLDGQTLETSERNYNKANQSDTIFDDAYKAFILAFLVVLGNKILDGVDITLTNFIAKKILPSGIEKSLAEKMIGFVDGKIIKGGYLESLGKMGIVRQTFHNYVVKAVSSGQRMNLFLRNAKPLFVSSKTRSTFSQYYMRYAYDSVAQAMNSIALYIADANNLDTFEYHGGLVKDSRPWCVAHAGNIYTREEAETWDNEEWKGKIPNLPFLIQVGGYNCQHSINWLPNG